MRTISRKILLRLAAQADEADIYGDEKVACNLTEQIKKHAALQVRSDDQPYEYSKEELTEDLEGAFWDAAVRVFDYYDETPDAKQIQEIVDFEVESFLGAIEETIHKDIGSNEPETPGEEREEGETVSEKIFDVDDGEQELEYDDTDDEDDDEEENEEEKE